MPEPNGFENATPAGETRRPLHPREEHFYELVAGVEDYAIFLLDDRGHVVSWNAGAQHIKGYTADEIIGKPFTVFYTPEALSDHWPERELREAARKGRFEDEGWRVRKDGSRFWAKVVITALWDDDGRLRGFLKITRDLTDRKGAEETLRQSEERFRLLVESVQDYAIFLLSPEGRVASWNVGAERIKGYTADEIIGKHFSCFFPPEARAQRRPDWELRTAIEQGRVEDEGWRVRKDGEQFWANVVITALFDKEGQLRGFAKVTRDLTDRRKIEALQEADREKNQFLALLAHELRNPLAPVRNALYILGQLPANPEVASVREIAERQIQQMARLLDDILDLSRITEGKMELRTEVLDMASVVSRAVETVGPQVQERQHQLTVAVPAGSLWVHGDIDRLEQVVVNLLTNAAKYTDMAGHIWVTGERDSTDVVLRVRDSGIGVDPIMLPRIFDLFVQAERRLDRSRGGLGVGLSLVRKVVELHGGSVVAFSAGLGKGSEFVVRLPGVDIMSEDGRVRPETEPGRDEVSSLRVLVVDDNPDAADSLAMLLRLMGQEVRVAYDGPAALGIAQAFQPHIVILDIGMPSMDGYQVARRLREQPEFRRTVLVAMTGWGHEEDKRRSREAGFDHHVTKPADPAAVQKLLADYRAKGAV